VATTQPMIEAGSTRGGRWLQQRRLKLALWTAVVEGIVVAVSHDLTRWTVLVIGVIVLAFYVLAGRNMKWDVGRHLSWIAAASQAMALLVVLFAFIFEWIAIGIVAIIAIIALIYLFSDHKRT
jgi:phosphatidylserine synthase